MLGDDETGAVERVCDCIARERELDRDARHTAAWASACAASPAASASSALATAALVATTAASPSSAEPPSIRTRTPFGVASSSVARVSSRSSTRITQVPGQRPDQAAHAAAQAANAFAEVLRRHLKAERARGFTRLERNQRRAVEAERAQRRLSDQLAFGHAQVGGQRRHCGAARDEAFGAALDHEAVAQLGVDLSAELRLPLEQHHVAAGAEPERRSQAGEATAKNDYPTGHGSDCTGFRPAMPAPAHAPGLTKGPAAVMLRRTRRRAGAPLARRSPCTSASPCSRPTTRSRRTSWRRRPRTRGFESLWLPEHTHIPASRKTPYPAGTPLPQEYWHTLDPFGALCAAAAVTKTIKLATGICLLIERDPIVTAKEVATVDHLSNGRFIFGIGGGWNVEEMENHGTAFKTRFKKLKEQVAACRAIWTEKEAEFPRPVRELRQDLVVSEAGAGEACRWSSAG